MNSSASMIYSCRSTPFIASSFGMAPSILIRRASVVRAPGNIRVPSEATACKWTSAKSRRGFINTRRSMIVAATRFSWKKQVLDNVASLGANGSDDGEEERERETAKLYNKIGQLTVEPGFLGQKARAMRAPDRSAMVELRGKDLSVRSGSQFSPWRNNQAAFGTQHVTFLKWRSAERAEPS